MFCRIFWVTVRYLFPELCGLSWPRHVLKKIRADVLAQGKEGAAARGKAEVVRAAGIATRKRVKAQSDAIDRKKARSFRQAASRSEARKVAAADLQNCEVFYKDFSGVTREVAANIEAAFAIAGGFLPDDAVWDDDVDIDKVGGGYRLRYAPIPQGSPGYANADADVPEGYTLVHVGLQQGDGKIQMIGVSFSGVRLMRPLVVPGVVIAPESAFAYQRIVAVDGAVLRLSASVPADGHDLRASRIASANSDSDGDSNSE